MTFRKDKVMTLGKLRVIAFNAVHECDVRPHGQRRA